MCDGDQAGDILQAGGQWWRRSAIKSSVGTPLDLSRLDFHSKSAAFVRLVGRHKGRSLSTELTHQIEGFLPTRCAGQISCYMHVDSVTVRASCHSLLRGWPYSPLGDIARARFRLHLPVAAV
jgi:hypothetical protein